MKNKTFIATLSILLVIGLGFAFTTSLSVQQEPWEVPAKYDKMDNPIDVNKASLKLGKKLYKKHCKSCHGSTGLGDGSKAATLDTPSGDFSTDEFHEQTDGSLFYKTIEGRGDMPSFKKKLPEEEDIWSIVNYIRTFN